LTISGYRIEPTFSVPDVGARMAPSGLSGNDNRTSQNLTGFSKAINLYYRLQFHGTSPATESLDDIIAKITRIQVRDTVPDSILDQPDKISRSSIFPPRT
jgi:hypothetical protein